ncbi:MAG: PorT family protein [Bacteroidetes bacterium]|nr:PorT family protein [Bacteroidota bacterium]
MKTKGLIFTALFTLLFLVSNAQVKFGIKEAVNFSTQSELGLLWDNNDIKTGFTLGAVIDYRFHQTLSLQTELNYKREGLAYENEELTGKTKVNQDYDYYNIPVLLKGRFNEELGLSDKWMVSFFGGPYYSYLRKAESEVETSGITTVSNIEENTNESDWGMVLGGEVARVFEKGELFFDVRYEMGLSDVTKNEDIKNKVIGLGIGFRF